MVNSLENDVMTQASISLFAVYKAYSAENRTLANFSMNESDILSYFVFFIMTTLIIWIASAFKFDGLSLYWFNFAVAQ